MSETEGVRARAKWLVDIAEGVLAGSYKWRFPEGFNAMIKEMKRHQPTKGDSWETIDIYEILWMLKHSVNDIMIGSTHALDIANLALMLHIRLKTSKWAVIGGSGKKPRSLQSV